MYLMKSAWLHCVATCSNCGVRPRQMTLFFVRCIHLCADPSASRRRAALQALSCQLAETEQEGRAAATAVEEAVDPERWEVAALTRPEREWRARGLAMCLKEVGPAKHCGAVRFISRLAARISGAEAVGG